MSHESYCIWLFTVIAEWIILILIVLYLFDTESFDEFRIKPGIRLLSPLLLGNSVTEFLLDLGATGFVLNSLKFSINSNRHQTLHFHEYTPKTMWPIFFITQYNNFADHRYSSAGQKMTSRIFYILTSIMSFICQMDQRICKRLWFTDTI